MASLTRCLAAVRRRLQLHRRRLSRRRRRSHAVSGDQRERMVLDIYKSTPSAVAAKARAMIK